MGLSYVPVIRTGIPVDFGNTTIDGTLDVTGDTTLADVEVDNLDVGGDLTVTGTSTYTGDATFNGGISVTADSSMGVIHMSASDATQFSVSGTLSVTGASTLGTVTSGGRLVDADMVAADHGFESWTHDPYYASSSAIAINGRVYVVKIPIRRNCTIDTLWWSIGTAGATPVAGQNEVGLYSSAGVKLASTNVDAAISSSGAKSTTITAQALTAGFVWQAFVFNATTAPTLARGSSFESTPSANLPTTALRAAVVTSGATALPASFDPATLSTTNCLTFWSALEPA